MFEVTNLEEGTCELMTESEFFQRYDEDTLLGFDRNICAIRL